MKKDRLTLLMLCLLAGMFLLGSCKVFKRDKCGDCPTFKLEQQDPQYQQQLVK